MLQRKLSVQWIMFFVGDQTGGLRSSRSFLSKPARSLSLFIPLKAKHSTIHFLHSSEVP
jgi:hypothetical protein